MSCAWLAKVESPHVWSSSCPCPVPLQSRNFGGQRGLDRLLLFLGERDWVLFRKPAVGFGPADLRKFGESRSSIRIKSLEARSGVYFGNMKGCEIYGVVLDHYFVFESEAVNRRVDLNRLCAQCLPRL